jgi:bisphosphoglycerate-dependent phosphoglycerate mutase
MKTVKRRCNNENCRIEYEAREADLKRGWGKSCSKRCAAIVRKYGGRKMAAASRKYRGRPNDNRTYEIQEEPDQGWDAHKLCR